MAAQAPTETHNQTNPAGGMIVPSEPNPRHRDAMQLAGDGPDAVEKEAAGLDKSSTSTGAPLGRVQTGERTLKTALACIEVSTWLFETGFGDEAEVILRAFATTGFPACDWLSELKAMSRDELSQLGRSARKTSAAVRHEPSSNSNGRESFANQIHDHNGDVHKGGGYQNGHHQNGRHQNGYHHANGKGSSHDIVNEQQLNRRRAPAPSSTSHSTPRRGSMEADVADVEAAVALFESAVQDEC